MINRISGRGGGGGGGGGNTRTPSSGSANAQLCYHVHSSIILYAFFDASILCEISIVF